MAKIKDIKDATKASASKKNSAEEAKSSAENTENAETTETSEAENANEAAAEETAEAETSKGSSKKKDKKDEVIDDLQEQLKRRLAEFENYRNRTEKEKSAMFDMGARSIIEKILPVIDNFERGLATKPESEESKAFADGMEMVYKQLLNELTAAGLAVIETEGCEFNPDLHNAVMQVEDGDKESGTVAQELQRGYTYHEVVVRHSMVSVVQ